MKTTIYIIATLAIGYLLAGCKLETSHNGVLDGYWKLCSVDSLTIGTTSDLSDESLFWMVEKDLLMVRDNNDSSNQGYVMRFHQTDSTLFLSNAQLYNKFTGNELLEDFTPLHRFGISTQPELFEINHLSSRHMSLSTESLRLNFKKF